MLACEAAHISHDAVLQWREKDPAFADAFNTEIPPEKDQAYRKWLKKMSAIKGRDVSKDMEDYDVQGYFLEFGDEALKGGHGPDKYKKPNHPTFSDESIYHGKEFQGGQWGHDEDGREMFSPGPTNYQLFGKDKMKKYFDTYERGVKLNESPE